MFILPRFGLPRHKPIRKNKIEEGFTIEAWVGIPAQASILNTGDLAGADIRQAVNGSGLLVGVSQGLNIDFLHF